jgi:hypothetical protein
MSNKFGRRSKYDKSYITFYFLINVEQISYMKFSFLIYFSFDSVLTDTQQVKSS